MAFCLPPGEHFLGYWVAGPDDDLTPGRRWYNWVWYRPASADTRLHELLTGIDGNVYMEGIPPHLIQPNFVAAMKADASNLLAPFLAKTVWATNRPFLQPIYEASSERLVFDRCITIGDAAFTARPHIGMGVSKAADDAARLAEAFCSHPDSSSGAVTRSIEHFTIALKNWEAQRLAFGRATVQQSANLGAYVAGSSENVAIKRLHAYYRQPEIVMQQIAAGNPYLYLNTDVCISLNLK